MSIIKIDLARISSLADMLEEQARVLEQQGEQARSSGNSMALKGEWRQKIENDIRTNSSYLSESGRDEHRMAEILRRVAETYRNSELKNVELLGASAVAGFGGGEGGGGFRGSDGPGGENVPPGSQNGNGRTSTVYSPDPVNLNTGNFILDHYDLQIQGFIPLVFRRFYNSRNSFSGMLGSDWNSNFEVDLSFSPEKGFGADATVVLEDGRNEYFVLTDKGGYRPTAGSAGELLREGEGFVYRSLDGSRRCFDEKGLYIRFENARRNGFTLSYGDGRLNRVLNDTGESLAFSYTPEGLLASVKDHTGRSCFYEFENGKLAAAILPDGNSFRYSYSAAGKLCKVVNPNLDNAVETEYDREFRVTSQTFADGTTNQFEYKDAERAVVMVERNGCRSTHYHDTDYRNVRNVYPDGEESYEYNERGLKTRITDRMGAVTRMQYDNRGNLTGIISSQGDKISATYNSMNLLLALSVNGKTKLVNRYNEFGDLILSSDALGRETAYAYDGAGRMTELKLADGSIYKAVYDARGNLIIVTVPGGAESRFEYDGLNRITGFTDARGNRTSYSYDVMNRLVSETRPDGYTRTYEYDSRGNNIRFTDYDGSVVEREFNENNRMSAVTDAAGRKFRFSFDSMWNVSGVTLPDGAVYQYLYNESNRLSAIRDPEGHEIRKEYDPAGNVTAQIDAEGNRTELEWDGMGRCVRKTLADGGSTEFVYDEEDHVIIVRDAEGTELLRTFDDAGQLTEERDSTGRCRSYTYNKVGDLVSVTDETGLKTEYRYGPGIHEPLEIIYPGGVKEQFVYDPAGNLSEHRDIYGHLLKYEYDSLNRLTSLREENGKALMEYQYDVLGRLISEKDAGGHEKRYEFTAAGTLAAVTDALGNVTKYSYDLRDNLTGIQRFCSAAGKNVSIQYTRNLLGELTGMTDASGHTESYEYNGNGQMIRKTDRDENITEYSYNNSGLLSSVIWGGSLRTDYSYSLKHQITEVRDWSGITKIRYNDNGQPLEITYPDENSVRIEYNSRGGRERIIYPDGEEVSYVYDDLNRLSGIRQRDLFTAFDYNRYGDIASRKLPDGSETRYEYSSAGLISRILHLDKEGVLDDINYGYDLYGRKTIQKVYRRDLPEACGTFEYSYDPAGRLQEVQKDRMLLRRYSHDAFGSRTGLEEFLPGENVPARTDYEYSLNGALLKKRSAGHTEEYRYDRRGNLIEQLSDGVSARTFMYNALNRIASAKTAGGKEARYRYNGLGFRTGMDISGSGRESSAAFYSDYTLPSDNLLAKTENGHAWNYIYGQGIEGYSDNTDDTGWFLTDPAGSVLRTTEASGETFAAAYDEFGTLIPSSRIKNSSFGFSGFIYDSVAGSWFAQARHYRSENAVFDAMDRFGGDITSPETLNPYAYCVNDPCNRTDKTAYWFGLDDAIAAGLGAVGGLVGTFVGDVATNVIEGRSIGSWEMSSWQEYTGAAAGGLVGGVTTLYAGPIAGGAVAGGVGRLTTEGLTYASDPAGYNKSGWQIAGETFRDTAFGALGGLIGEGVTKLKSKIASTKPVKALTQKLLQGGKVSNWFGNKLFDMSTGKPAKLFDQMSHFLRMQHTNIAANGVLKNQLLKILTKRIPVYFGQEVASGLFKIFSPGTWISGWYGSDKADDFKKWLKETLGIDTGEGPGENGNVCAVAA